MANSVISDNPWKGLNFYVEGEVLYGRNSEIESLSQYIFNNTQTVLYGKSGIGKSSILNAGVFPLARQHGMLPVGIRLDHNSQTSYIRQIHDAIVASGVDVHEIVPVIHAESETLWEYMHRHIFFDKEGKRMQLLLVLDQFEEIFTLQQDEQAKQAFFSDLADLLNDVTPLYIVNANKDSLPQEGSKAQEVEGDLDLSDINLDLDDMGTESENRYLQKIDYHIVFTLREDFLSYLERYSAYIPVMKANRYALLPLNEEQAADIIMKPREGLVSKDVAELIIRKVTGRSDFTLDGIPEIEVDAAVLSLYLSRLYIKKGVAPAITAELVNQFSDDIIKDFYEESVADLPAKEIEKIEDELLTYDGRRNNVSRNDLLREGVSNQVIRTLVEERKLLRQFSYQDDIRIEFMHDILCPVVDDRINQREAVARQEEQRRKQEEEKNALLRKSRKRLTISITSTIVLGLLFFLYLLLFRIKFSNDYATFTTHNGWPVGIGQTLNDDDVQHMVVHYRLTRKGLLKSFKLPWYSYSNPNVMVEVLNRHHHPATNILVESPMVALNETDGDDRLSRAFAVMQLQTASWQYTADERGNLARQTAYDINGNALYSILYYRDIAEDEEAQTQMVWMNYVDKEGKSMRLRNNGADRMRATLVDGRLTGYLFFNELGSPQQNSRGAYGYKYETDDTQGYQKAIIPLDEYGDTIPEMVLRFDTFDKYQRWISAGKASAEYGGDRIIYNMGERIDSLLYDEEGRQSYRSETIKGLQRNTFVYDKRGNLTEKSSYIRAADGLTLLTERTTNTYFNTSDTLKECTSFRALAETKYTRECHEYKNNTHTATYFSGNSLSALKPANKKGTNYYKIVTTRQAAGTENHVTSVYFAVDSISGKDTESHREEFAYDHNNLLLRKIVYKQGKRSKSIEYEIENGLVVGQHVVGLTGTIIRCPQWDEDGLSYYRKKFLCNFAGDTVSIKAVNEFGEESIIAYANKEVRLNVVPGDEIMLEGKDYMTYGIGIYKYSVAPIDDSRMVQYLHITDTAGTYYRCGLRDGDIVLKNTTEEVLTARPNPAVNSYDIKHFHPQEGEKGMEIYPVPFTEKEMERLHKATAKKK